MVKTINDDEKLTLALNLMSVILTPPRNVAIPETPEKALNVYLRTTEANNENSKASRNTLALFNDAQKKAIQTLIEYAKANKVVESNAVNLVESYSSGMRGGSKQKTRKRKGTRRQK